MIAQNTPFRLLDNQIKTVGGVRPVANHITQAVNRLNSPPFDVGQDGCQGFKVRMYIAQNRKHTRLSIHKNHISQGRKVFNSTNPTRMPAYLFAFLARLCAPEGALFVCL
jgi:hypothetical protein